MEIDQQQPLREHKEYTATTQWCLKNSQSM